MISALLRLSPVGTADNDVIQRLGKLSADAEDSTFKKAFGNTIFRYL